MTDAEKIVMVQTLVDNDAEATTPIVSTYLAVAKNKILARLYPYSDNTEIPAQYDVLHCELASRLFLRRGGEGEVSHNENGINRTYASVDDSDILCRIVPFAKLC